MRKILLVGDYPPPYGGLSTQIEVLRRRLLALGDEVVVLDIGERRRETRPECVPVRGPIDFARKVAAHARRGFTIHLHTNGHNLKSWIVTLVCALAGRRIGRRTVVSLGSGIMPAFVRDAPAPVRALVRASVGAAGLFVVRNEPARAALVAMGAAPEAVKVLSGFYGVAREDIGRFPYAAARFRRGHRPLIGVVASPGPQYGLALLIDAAARLRPRYPELGVVLIGTDRMEEGRPCWALAMGELDRPSLLAVMEALDVFVRPTYFDGDASSVREAQALGVRVVASATDFRPDGVRLFPCGDADALAESIDAALEESPVKVEATALPMLLDVYDALERTVPQPAVVPGPAVTTQPSVAPPSVGGSRAA
jgi:glycogen(starch) synthase